MLDDIKKMTMPYGVYINPYTGYIYATDAASFAEGGELYQWSPDGELLGKHSTYINPAHFLALASDDVTTGIGNVAVGSDADARLYNLQGMPVDKPRYGQIYISKGRKILYTE